MHSSVHLQDERDQAGDARPKLRLTNLPGCGSMRLLRARMGTHYESLKVTEDAPQEVIRAAYRVLSLKYHPDKSSGSPHALRMMQTLNEAYAILSDAGKRADYDGELHRLRHPAPFAEKTAPVRWRDVRFRGPRPAWLKSSLLFLSDARVVIPAVALIWWFVFRLLAGT